MKHFSTPQEHFGRLDAEAVGSLLATSSDIALVLDQQGIIQDLAFSNEEWSAEWYGVWLGQPWVDTVTTECRVKIEGMLAEARSQAAPRWRQVNHPSSWGADVPVTYTAVRFGNSDQIVACGRELWSTSLLQQRLVSAQQSMERHYAKMRHVETRYQLLFGTTTEAVIILDTSSWAIVEANPAACRTLGAELDGLNGCAFVNFVDKHSRDDVSVFLNTVRKLGSADELRIALNGSDTKVTLSASIFRQDRTTLALLRLMAPSGNAAIPHFVPPSDKSDFLGLIENSSDAFVITDATGHLVDCNPAFLSIAQLPNETQATGRPLSHWLGRSSVDMNVLIANLRQNSGINLYPAVLKNEFGGVTNVEVSGTNISTTSSPHYGFTIRNIDQRAISDAGAEGESHPQSNGKLSELVGHVPLRDIVRDTVDAIEKRCIESALQLTSDSRAAAAELLGISRQSLYIKLNRYGLGSLPAE